MTAEEITAEYPTVTVAGVRATAAHGAALAREELLPPPQLLRVEAVTQAAALDGNLLLAERLVANLVDNAVRHNVADGRVWVATGTRDGRAILSVTNTGPVIPPGEVDRLFQPFQRLNRRRGPGGYGLGLSIVRGIAAAHGASISARARPGGGLAVEVSFPPRS